MTSWFRAVGNWFEELWASWNRFWFEPAAPHTLGLIRILAGSMLFYTHLIWSLDLLAFLGPDSWITRAVSREMHRGSYAWSFWWYVDSPALVWTLHLAALAVFALLTIGCFTRFTSLLAAAITLSYCHRLSGSLFGLDQVNAMLAIYLAVGPSGAAYSVDRWLSQRRPGQGRGGGSEVERTVGANIAIRLVQLHLCVIYLFGGIGKMRGEMWWDGSAVWFALASYEYQSMDLTWLVRFPWLIALCTHLTVLWETFYPFLVWPRLTRPLAVGMAVLVHGGIALFLGMPTFGFAMIIANLSFLEPDLVDGIWQRLRQGLEATSAWRLSWHSPRAE